MNTTITKRAHRVSITLAAAAIAATLAVAAAALAQDGEAINQERCDAYYTLAMCNLKECIMDGVLRADQDELVTEAEMDRTLDRCSNRVYRELKGPHKRYTCEWEMCNARWYKDKLDDHAEDLAECLDKCEGRPDKPGCADHCAGTYEDRVWERCEDAKAVGCHDWTIIAYCKDINPIE